MHNLDEASPQHVKITLNLEPNAWHGYGTESLWAVPVPDGYLVDNVPFYAIGLSLADVVSTKQEHGILFFQGVIKRGGHSTYRIFLSEGVTPDGADFRDCWIPLEQAGCRYEAATTRLLAVDVSATSDIFHVYNLLQSGYERGVWDFEEGHCGHVT